MNMIQKINKIMAVGAHLDDIEISCGGMISDATSNSCKVKMLVLSESAYSNYHGKIGRTREEALNEGLAAANLLGAELEVLDFPTKDIPHNSEAIESIEKRVAEFMPDLIITHWVYDSHPSHKNTCLSTIAACRYFNNILMFDPMMPSGRSYHGFRGQFYFKVSEAGIKSKIEALKAHRSQYIKYGEHNWINAVISRGIHRGYEIGVDNAECYEIVRLVAQR
jgi:LmbE family N-acetylglucosaminyl deacetylase